MKPNYFFSNSEATLTASQLYKKFLMLLLIMVVGVSSAWAGSTIATFERTTAYEKNGDDAYYLTTNNGIHLYAQGLINTGWNWVTSYNTDIQQDNSKDGKYYVFLSNSNISKTHFKLQFSNDEIKVGDVISINCWDAFNDNGDTHQIGYAIGKPEGKTNVSLDVTDNNVHAVTHTITKDEIITDGASKYILIGQLEYKNTYVGSITVTRPNYTVTFGGLYSGGTVSATVDGSSITSGASVPNGKQVTFTATPNGENLRWKWVVNGSADYNNSETRVETVSGDLSVQHEFGSVKVYAYTNDANMGTVNAACGGNSGTYLHLTPYPGDVTFTATPKEGYKFDGWYPDEARNTLVSKNNPFTKNNPEGTYNLYAKFSPVGKTVTLTCDNTTNLDAASWTVQDYSATRYIGATVPVAEGKTVTFTATPKDGYLVRWQVNGVDKEWNKTFTYTMTNEEVTVKLVVVQGVQLNAGFTSNSEYKTTTAINFIYNSTDNWGQQALVHPGTSNIVLTASDVEGYTFKGWYSDEAGNTLLTAEAGTKTYNIPDDATGTNNYYAKYAALQKITPKPDCGGKYFDQTKLNAGNGSSLSISEGKGTVTTGSGGGYVSFNFDEGYNLTELYKWTVGIAEAQKANLSYISFCKDGNAIARGGDDKMTFYQNANDRVLDDQYKQYLASVDEIRIGFNANTTTTVDFFYLQTKPDVMFKVPTLASPTTTEMTLSQGETLKLHITDTYGFWREYTDGNYNAENNTRIANNAFSPSYDFADLPIGNYYFRVRHGGNCELGHYHETDPVDVHVVVKKAINTIEVNGTTREYDVYAPNGISGTVGVVISLHGASNDYDNGRVDFNSIADTEKNTDKKFVVVYPRGLNHQEIWGGVRSWETYDEESTNDTEFFKAIVNEINSKKNGLTVDYSRIYLAGFSNGGMMAYKVAHKDADFYAACASVGGFPVNESHLWHAGSKPVPFVHIHGTKDNVVRIEADQENQEKYKNDVVYDVNTIIHNMVYRNGATFNPNGQSDDYIVASNGNVEREIHNAEAGGAAYYYYKIKGMWHSCSHDWTGDSKDDIAAAIWAFFNKSGITNNVDPTLKFRIYDTANFWNLAGGCGFDNKNTGTSVLSYGGYTKNDANKNVYHSLQFNGGINGAPHYLKLSVFTTDVGGAANENSAHYFLVKLTKTGATTPVFAKRYQAGRGTKDLYINFSALPGFNEYKLEITKSSPDLTVQVNGVEFHSGKSATENPTYYFDVAKILEGMNPIYQPVLDKTWDGIAKEYLPIADIPVGGNPLTIEDNIKVNQEPKSSIPSTLVNNWNGANEATISGKQFLNIAKSGKSGEDIGHKSYNACILVRDDGDTHNYTIDKTKGIKISQFGRAQMPEYLNGTRGTFPTHGVIALKVQGTIDFTLLAHNDKTYSDPNNGRSTLKVYYTNNQLNGELKELKNWWFFGTRGEGYTSDSYNNSQAPLSVNVRLPQLGSDGTCTLFITYEGKNEWYPYENEAEGNHVWIKGFVIKRPDLKPTIGRTDSKYVGKKYNGQENTTLTRFGENKPYIWSFENVGFNNTKLSDLDTKKVNSQDARTYVSGGTDDENNHLLLFSDISSNDNRDKVQFDGRVAGQEHIELQKPSVYNIPTATTDRRLYNPITSNGLKVNVTGSGWFKIQCAAPNGPVNMKVYSQTNYGTSYMNLLREFRIEKSSSETDWKEYTVYLKGHVNRDGNNGFWDGEPNSGEDKKANAEEILQMSLFVVFDAIDGATYDDGDVATATDYAQLNIHQLSWLNEEPADYVFQREEDPKLLTTWQAIRRDASGKKSTSEGDPVILWWMAGSELKEKKDGNTIETYNPAAQFTTTAAANGVKSPGGYASTSVPSDAGTYNAYWDIAAPAATNAHTEAAYAKGGSDFTPEKEYIYNSGNNTEFDIPISGSFIRICAMKNTYVAAHVLPSAANAKVYVVDETGSPIPYKPSGADNPDSKTRGYVAALENLDFGDNTAVSKAGTTMRIDFCANAGKEYFICAKGASISLARLEAQDWRYKPMKSGTKLALTDNSNNSSNITNAYNTGEFYRDATLPRSLTANQWASIVLPFSLNEKKFEEVFGVGAKCLHFTDVDKENNTVKLTHHFYNMIVAGRPIFIRPSKDVTNLEITDVTLQANVVKNTTTTNGFEFFGSYDNSTINNNDIYLSTGNTFKYLKTSDGNSKTYPGMRSFIKSPSGYNPSGAAAVSSAKAIFVNYDDENLEDATGIEELISSEFGENTIIVRKSTKVYDLNGRVVANATDFENLPSGIYIVNGKKYVK